jgi:hypothetical protein
VGPPMRHHAMSSEPFSIMWRAPRRRLCMRGGVWRRIATAGLVAVALCYVFYSAGRHGAATAATTTSLPRGPLLLLRTRAKGTTSAQQKQPLPPDSGGQQRAWESATLAAVASLRVSAGPQPVRWFKKGGPRVLPKRSLNRHNTDETLWPLDSDVWIASYPKSGQTWIRFLLANIINYHKRAPIDFSTVEDRIPFLEDGREEWIAWAFKSAPSPRIFKSHQPFLTPPAKYPCNRQLSQSNVRLALPCVLAWRCVVDRIFETVAWLSGPVLVPKLCRTVSTCHLRDPRREGRHVQLCVAGARAGACPHHLRFFTRRLCADYQFRHGLGQNLGMNFTQFLDPKNKHYPGVSWHLHGRLSSSSHL